MDLSKISICLALSVIGHASFCQPRNNCACCTEHYREFNFWLGKWKVYNPEGKIAGENTITVQQDSCMILENWVSTSSGFRGTSCNFYNRTKNKWQQLWIDNQGGNLELEGELINGEMILTSREILNEKGQLQIDRIRWTPHEDGTVSQLWTMSINRGKDWTVVFDGLYKKN